MRFMRLLPLLLPLAAGCGSNKYAPVSGQVTLNGKPLANASVTFAPVPVGGSTEPGPSSAGKTDASGRYTLSLIGPDGDGAVVGKHKVRIALIDEMPADSDLPSRVRQLPMKYNGQTTLEFEVPPSGSDKADFKLTVP